MVVVYIFKKVENFQLKIWASIIIIGDNSSPLSEEQSISLLVENCLLLVLAAVASMSDATKVQFGNWL